MGSKCHEGRGGLLGIVALAAAALLIPCAAERRPKSGTSRRAAQAVCSTATNDPQGNCGDRVHKRAANGI